MQVAINKTYYALAKGTLARDLSIALNGEYVQRRGTNRYPGVYLDEKRNFLGHADNVCAKSVRLINKIINIANNTYRIPLRVARVYLDTVMARPWCDTAQVYGRIGGSQCG